MIKIANREISEKSPVFIIAELSANHNHNFDIAAKTIVAAKKAGCDAIKLQTYTPDTMTIDCKNDFFKIKQGTLWDGKTLYELYQEAYTPWEWQPKLIEIAQNENIICFSTPFDHTAVDFLEELEVPCHKIASFEIRDIPLIEYTASKLKPMLISTGIASFSDIEAAVDACRKVGNNQLILLKCTSAYPAPIEESNLLTIPDLKDKFGCIVGLSDHSLGNTVPLTSVGLGVKVIEKHFIIDKSVGGPDVDFSLEFEEMKQLVKMIRDSEKALGTINYEISDKIKKNEIFSRSLFIVEDINLGEQLTYENVRSIRPGYGMHPKHLQDILGQKAAKDIKRGEPLKWEMIQESS